MTNLKLFLLLSLLCMGSTAGAKDYRLASPDGRIGVTLCEADGLALKVTCGGKTIVEVTGMGLDAKTAGIRSVKTTTLYEHIDAPFYRQRSFDVAACQMDAKLRGGFGLQVRAYNDGVAYRYYTTNKGETIVTDETATFCFPDDAKAWLPYSTNDEHPFAMSFQNIYHETPLSQARHKPAFLPATVQTGDVKVTILESDLRSYPGMFLQNTPDSPKLSMLFPRYPKTMGYYRWRGMSYVQDTEDFIAKSAGPRTYPWRIMAITTDDCQMPVNNLVYALATPNQIGDTSWIKPGKVAWDWWNDWNLKGVSFVAGINTPTYLYYIDFAASYGLPYVVLDEGWYDSAKGDILHPVADIDLQQLIDHAREKGVGIVLWMVFNVLDEHLQETCEKYAAMGVKGFKIDFLDRNDQTAVEMAERLARTCAQYHLFVDYHGFYAPTGMSRTYPNILNYEGVFGLEECRWAKGTDMPRYDVTFPFIRMMAGQVDFTPGAMRNGTKQNWVECYQNPVSMGTRCHQAACYVVHDTPFTMLCDAPTSYEAEPRYTRFIAQIPDEWDETRVLQGKMGEYIVTARRRADVWYVAGQTNWDGRELQLALDFLGEGDFQATCLVDGINANHNAEDYRLTVHRVRRTDVLPLQLASGGGFVVRLSRGDGR